MPETADGREAVTRNLTITRIVAAAPAAVFNAWIDPDQLARWWGPRDFTNPVCELDARPGGLLRIVMRGPGGDEYPMTGVFHDIADSGRIIFTAIARDKDGTPLLEARTSVTFLEQGGKTRLTVEARAVGLVLGAVQMLEGMEAGWTQSLERLQEFLAKA